MSPSKDDEVVIGPNGVEYSGPPGGLEALLSSKAIVSEAFEIEHGGDKVRAKFRELSNHQKTMIKMFAIQYVEDRRREQEEDGKGEWRDAEADRDVLIGEEFDLRMLQASMIDPDTNAPACSLGWLRRRMGTKLQTMLGDRYAVFEQSIDPDEVTEETIKAVIEDVKKNIPLDLLLMQSGSILLARSLQYSVNLLESYLTDKCSGSGSGETPP